MLALGTALSLAMTTASVAAPVELSPGTIYDPKIPTLKQVVGHDPAQEITPPEGIAAYLKALAAAAPERTRLIEYARTWEGRPLHVLIVGSAERMAKLSQVQADLKRLADPRGLPAGEADRLVRELPVVVWFLHAVHGNEISSSDAALAEAYHLLAAQGDETVAAILKESLVLIDPLENPDGRARFVFQNLLGRASSPDAEPASAEHDEPWPGGRSNHYLFDMNRDWFAQSQPETVGRTRVYLDWFPQVVVDLHEMGGDSTYYFAPPANPINPHVTKQQRGWFEAFGKANAASFDERGFAYFIREVFDSFYPGYGESWPIFQGAVGMTYEQASARSLVYRRRDESILTYGDGVLHHFTAAITTAATAAHSRERLLRDFLDYRRTAVEEGTRGTQEYLLPPGVDPSRTDRLARLLAAQGIEVRRATEAVRLGSRTLPAGTYVVPAAQPSGRLVRNLLDPHTEMDEAFVKEQERRRKKRLPDQIYDVTAWSLPLVFDVECLTSDRPVTARTAPFDVGSPTTAPALADARVGYLLPWGSGSAAAVAEALQVGLKARTAERGFKLAGKAYASGTAILRVSDNGRDLKDKLGAIAARHDVQPVAIDSGWVDEGISLGSGEVHALKAPRVLLAWDAPTSSLSAGWARYVLERRLGQPATAVRVSSLGRVDLRRFDVVVLPSGDYGTSVPESVAKRLADWVRSGGTLITLGEASRWAAGEKVGLLETKSELRDGRPDVEPSEKDEKKKAEPIKPFDLEKAIQPERERPEATSGALVRVVLDPEHWLSAGTDGEIQAIVEGDRVFTPIKLDKGRNVGVYATKDRLMASGLLWEEAKEALAQKAFLIGQPLGEGHVIAFAEDPNYRAFAEATELLFMNAVLLGPAY